MGVCWEILQEIGGLPEEIDPHMRDSRYINEYLYLRDSLRRYIAEERSPKVDLLNSPTGNFDSIEEYW